MKIEKIFKNDKSKLKVNLITLSELEEIEVQLDKDKEPEIISFDKFLLMSGKELKEKEIEISSLQFLQMLEGTDIPVMIEKIDPECFRITKTKEEIEEMAFKMLKMPDEEIVNIIIDEKTKQKMALLLKSWSETDFELFNNSNETENKPSKKRMEGIKEKELLINEKCPRCNSKLKKLDKVKDILKTNCELLPGNQVESEYICKNCGLKDIVIIKSEN